MGWMSSIIWFEQRCVNCLGSQGGTQGNHQFASDQPWAVMAKKIQMANERRKYHAISSELTSEGHARHCNPARNKAGGGTQSLE